MVSGIVPAIRYSDYALKGGGGVALLDRGVPGRELVGNTPLLLLHNVCDAYALTWRIHDREFIRPSAWMSGRGTQTYEYALLRTRRTGKRRKCRSRPGNTTLR